MREKLPYCTSCNHVLGFTDEHGNCVRCGSSAVIWRDSDDFRYSPHRTVSAFGWSLIVSAALVGCIFTIALLTGSKF